MKKYILMVVPFALFAQAGVHQLEYIDQYDRPMTSYQEWTTRLSDEPFRIASVYSTALMDHRQPLIDVVVNAQLYPQIIDSLNVYINDLETEGYTIQVDTIRGWNAAGLRVHLYDLLGSELVGAVFIGNVPFAWYEEQGAEGREEFPIDLYLMDLDGTWVDGDGDGLFDDHTGSKEPEIWVGRINAATMSWGSEVYLINNYLSKIHRYRTGGYAVPQKALAYVDDDWYGFNDCDLTQLYDTVIVVRNYNTTVATDFRSRFNDSYEWVQICSHSSPWGNTFKYTGGFAGTVFNFEVWFANPPWLFLNLFQCSGTRFFEDNFCGGCYIFGPQSGLLAIGSAKVGSMLHFDDFYGPLDSGISIGEAFRQWFEQWGITDPSWFYGMCICGDPTLKPKQNRMPRSSPYKWKMKFEESVQWSDPVPVDIHAESDGYVDAATDNAGRIWAAWVTGRSTTYGRTEICVAYNESGVWFAPHIIDAFEYWDFWPTLACDANGNAVLVWSRCYGRNYDIFFSAYEGSNWGIPFRVSNRAADALFPAMTLDGDNRLWVTLERWNHLNGDIYCRYHDGVGWQSMFAVTIGTGNDFKPAMATDSTGRAWTVWTSERYQDNRNIYVKNYNSGSGSWDNMYRITGNPSQDQDAKICVAGDGTVFVAWTTWRHGNSDIYFSRYTGTGWINPSAVTTDENSDEHCELVVDQDGYVWCVWQTDRTGDWEIVAKYYKDDEWQGVANVSNDQSRDILPAATLDQNGNIWVLFQSERNGNWDIFSSTILADLIEPQVTVLAPNGGEIWNIGDTETIRWTATDNVSVDSLSLFYSTNNGASWLAISSGEPNDSAYDWEIPPTPSTQCLVRVIAYDAFPNTGEDISDAVFTIRDASPPQVTVLYPNGGEVLQAGSIDTIRWQAVDNIGVDSVSLEFSPDAGNTWQFVASPAPIDTAYEWSVPGVHSTECLVRVRAYDAGDNMGEDESDSLFTIIDDTPPDVAVVVPNGGEIWYWSEIHAVEWNSQDNAGIDSVNVHLSLDGGVTYPVLITHVTGNDSTFDWTIPETTSYECLVRITAYDIGGNIAYDISDSLFAIGEQGIEEALGIPLHFAITMLSSNPFVDRFSMKLALPNRTPVKINIYDVRGRLVQSIVDGEISRGYHTLVWDDQKVAAGVYFIHIKTDDVEKTEKIIKLR